MTAIAKLASETWGLMNQLRAFDRFSGGRRVAALAALGFLSSDDPEASRLWTAVRNEAVHYFGADDISAKLLKLSAMIEDRHSALGRSFSTALTPDILQSGGALPELVAMAAPIVEASQLEHRTAFGQWFDAVLDMASQGRQVGEVTTPRPLARLMANLLRARPHDSVLDPTIGLGATLVELASQTPDLRLCGQEVNALAAALAILRLYLLGLSADIVLGDALRAPAQWGDIRTRFDRVICDPPYNLSTHGLGDSALLERFGHLPTNRSETFFVEHCLENLAPGGRAVLLLPLGFLARRGGEAKYRADLLERGRIEGAVALPGGVIPWTELPVAVLVLRGHDEPETGVRLVDASYLKGLGKRASERLTDSQVVELTHLYEGPVASGRSCVVSPSDALRREADLQPQHWLADDEEERVDLGALHARAVDADARAEAARKQLDPLMALFRLRAR